MKSILVFLFLVVVGMNYSYAQETKKGKIVALDTTSQEFLILLSNIFTTLSDSLEKENMSIRKKLKELKKQSPNDSSQIKSNQLNRMFTKNDSIGKILRNELKKYKTVIK